MLLKVALFVTIAIAGFGQAVLHLWNWLMPSLFGFHEITFGSGPDGPKLDSLRRVAGFHGRPGSGYRRQWRHRMRERWEKMTPEEREKFREGMRVRCGHFPREATEHKA
jgi:hypothetical protein